MVPTRKSRQESASFSRSASSSHCLGSIKGHGLTQVLYPSRGELGKTSGWECSLQSSQSWERWAESGRIRPRQGVGSMLVLLWPEGGSREPSLVLAQSDLGQVLRSHQTKKEHPDPHNMDLGTSIKSEGSGASTGPIQAGWPLGISCIAHVSAWEQGPNSRSFRQD